MNATSLGKIFLADLTEKELETYFKNKSMKRCTPNTITDINTIRTHLINIRQEGIAFDDEEWGLGIRSVAAGSERWQWQGYCLYWYSSSFCPSNFFQNE